MHLKTFIALNILLWALGCTSGGSTISQSAQPVQPTAARSTPVGVGDLAPDFTLADQHGQQVKLAAARGQSPVVLVFYRGYW